MSEYRDAMDSLRFTDEQKARMAARLADARSTGTTGPRAVDARGHPAGGTEGGTSPAHSAARHVATKRPRRRSRIFRRVAAVALVAALGLGGSTAYALATGRTPAAVFSDIFGGAPAQTEVVNRIGRPIGASATSNGITVTADAVIGDAHSYTVVFSIAREDGQVLDLSSVETNDGGKLLLTTGSGALTIDGVSSAGGGAWFYDADPTDSSIQYVEQMDNVKTFDGRSVAGRTARMHLDKIVAFDEDGNMTTFLEGTWDLKFQMSYEDASVELPTGQQVDCNGMEATVRELSVSPVGASVTYEIAGKPDYEEQESGRRSDHNQQVDDAFFGMPVTVAFADGTTEEFAGDWGGSMDNADGSKDVTTVTIGGAFDRIHEVTDIESITVGGVTVPVPATAS